MSTAPISRPAGRRPHRTTADRSERNARMVELAASGSTFAAIARRFAVTRERVRFIVRRAERRAGRRLI